MIVTKEKDELYRLRGVIKTFCVNDKCLIKTTCADYLREEIKEQAKKAKLPLSCTNFNCDIDGGNHG